LDGPPTTNDARTGVDPNLHERVLGTGRLLAPLGDQWGGAAPSPISIVRSMAFATCPLLLVEEPFDAPQEHSRPDAFDQNLLGAGSSGCLLLRHGLDKDNAPGRWPSRFDRADGSGAVVLRPLDAE
jgi:hypothetical protein